MEKVELDQTYIYVYPKQTDICPKLIDTQAVNELAIEQFDLPPLGPNDVRVAVKALGICQSDVHYLRHGCIGDFVLSNPMVIGHECSGVVEDVGEAVVTLKVGACMRASGKRRGANELNRPLVRLLAHHKFAPTSSQ